MQVYGIKGGAMAKKVMVVEDNAMNRLLLKDILKFHGYEVIEALNGEECIEKARRELPDLILMDMQMPVMDGFEASLLIKKDPGLKNVKIIAVTSLAMHGDKEKILESGFDGYLAKPIDTHKLPELIKKLIE